MKIPSSKLYKKQNERIIPSFHKKGVIVFVNNNGSLANLYFLDNPQTIIKNVPVSYPAQTAITYTYNKTTNLRCVVDIFDETNSSQMIVAYTY